MFISDWFNIPNALRTKSEFNPTNDYLIRLAFESTNPTLANVNVGIGRVSFEIRGEALPTVFVNGSNEPIPGQPGGNAGDLSYVYTDDQDDPKTSTDVQTALNRIITVVDGGEFFANDPNAA